MRSTLKGLAAVAFAAVTASAYADGPETFGTVTYASGSVVFAGAQGVWSAAGDTPIIRGDTVLQRTVLYSRTLLPASTEKIDDGRNDRNQDAESRSTSGRRGSV